MTADPFLELIRRIDRSSSVDVALEPPPFAVPAKAAKSLKWGCCTGCSRGVAPGQVVWCHAQPFHPECAVIEAVNLRAAA